MRHSNIAGLVLAVVMALGCDRSRSVALEPIVSPPRTLFTAALTGFAEEFSSSTLDPAWEVVEFTGSRVYGYASPANHYSLTANPGRLRYYLDPMTHWDGFAYGFQTSVGLHSCCNHDPGVELRRAFDGEQWLLEAAADHFLPYTNGRGLTLDVYFGDGNVGTYSVQFQRGRDVNQNYLRILLARRTGSDPWNYPNLEDMGVAYPLYGSDNSSLSYRLERNGGDLTATWSEDGGATWNTAWTHSLSSALSGLEQRVIITGLSWFNTGGSFADWDYVRLTPTLLTVTIDIKPGSNPSSINPKARGTTPVAILSTADFDAPSETDRASLTFGRTGDEQSLAFCSTIAQDVDFDGTLDLVCHFTTQQMGFQVGDTEGILKGETGGGRPIEGRDGVRIVNR